MAHLLSVKLWDIKKELKYLFTKYHFKGQHMAVGQYSFKRKKALFEFNLSRLKSEFDLLFTHSWRKIRWIHACTKGTSVKSDKSSLIQNMNSGHKFYSYNDNRCA